MKPRGRALVRPAERDSMPTFCGVCSGTPVGTSPLPGHTLFPPFPWSVAATTGVCSNGSAQTDGHVDRGSPVDTTGKRLRDQVRITAGSTAITYRPIGYTAQVFNCSTDQRQWGARHK